MTSREAIKAAELIEAETRYRHQLAREAFEAGRRAGQAEGRAALHAEQAQRHAELARSLGGPTFGELEDRRWGPGGREHFADPRPGDFPGRGAKPHPQPERQLEAEA
jgi:hypothetical protein